MNVTMPPKGILTLMKYAKVTYIFLKAPTNRSMEMGYETSQLVWTLDISQNHFSPRKPIFTPHID